MKEVTISIVSYCQKNLLDRCLGQIKSISLPASWRIIVVDNHSSDGSAEMVAQRHTWAKLIRLQENVGFGGGHNVAYSATYSPIFIVLNPDVKILPGSLELLVEAIERFPKAAIVGPQLLNPDGSLQYSARRFYDWKTILSRRLPFPGREKLNDLHLMKDMDPNTMRGVDWLLGAAMAVRRSAFEGKELFDTRYKLYFEDVDLCYFAHKKGWDVLYCPQSKMIHDHQRTSASVIFNSAVIKHFMGWIKFYLKTKRHCSFTVAGNKPVC